MSQNWVRRNAGRRRAGATGGGHTASAAPAAAQRLVPHTLWPCSMLGSVGGLGHRRPSAGAVRCPAGHACAAAHTWAAAGIRDADAVFRDAAAVDGLVLAAVRPRRNPQRYRQRQERPAVEGRGRRRRLLLRQQAQPSKVLLVAGGRQALSPCHQMCDKGRLRRHSQHLEARHRAGVSQTRPCPTHGTPATAPHPTPARSITANAV